MRCMSTMARREGKDAALEFFYLKDQGDVSALDLFSPGNAVCKGFSKAAVVRSVYHTLTL